MEPVPPERPPAPWLGGKRRLAHILTARIAAIPPPYWGGEADYGKGMFSRGDFARLAKILRGLEGRFLLSLNDRPEVRRTFEGFHLDRVETHYTVGQADQKAVRPELIISDGPRPGDGVVPSQLGLI